MEEYRCEEVSYEYDCGPTDGEIDYHADTEQFEDVDGSVEYVEMVIYFVAHGYEGDDEQPHTDYEGSHEGREHEGIERRMEVVLLPVFGYEVLNGRVEYCHDGDECQEHRRVGRLHLFEGEESHPVVFPLFYEKGTKSDGSEDGHPNTAGTGQGV